MQDQVFRLRTVVAIVATVCAAPHIVMADNKNEAIELSNIDVISTTPLPGMSVTKEEIPAVVQTVKSEDIARAQSLDISDYMNTHMSGVYVNEVQNNPLQADINYRGFTASPLLGTPQGLSVYTDGVRMNQPFGDTVNWDLIPKNAIAGMQMMSGSNPLFGLNTLGGALSIQTKDGRNNPGGAVQVTLGSYARKIGEFEYGGSNDTWDWFVAGTAFDDNGWREKSESDYQQLFGKLGWRGERTDLKLTYAFTDSDLNGNGLVPESFAKRDYDSVFTYPDNTQNESHFLNLDFSHFFKDNVVLTGNAYYRKTNTKTYNGDLNDEAFPWAPSQANNGNFGGQNIILINGAAYSIAENIARCSAAFVPGGEPGERCTGIINRTETDQWNAGLFAQIAVENQLFGKNNKYIVGGGYDYSHIKFAQTAEYGYLTLDRGIIGSGHFADSNQLGELDGELDDRSAALKGIVKTFSIYGTDTLALADNLHMTASARYNHTRVKNRDQQVHFVYDSGAGALTDEIDEEASLDGNHSFNRINPAIGLTFSPMQTLNMYAGYNEGSRAPTSIELGCANEDAPCRLPNSMAGDPPLEQVVTKTWEAGLRGKNGSGLVWSAGLFSARNVDDIMFVAAGTSGGGYFKNFGETRRRGIEASLAKNWDAFSFGANYTFLNATYESSETFNAAGNSTATIIANNDDSAPINVRPGDHIPGVPRNILKLFADYRINDKFTVGFNTHTVSSSYLRGNENNDHQEGGLYRSGGKISGYTVVNLAATFQARSDMTVFAKVNNLFDREYYTAGMLGLNPFNDAGVPAIASGGRRSTAVGEALVAPGAPRTAWVGVRWEFDRPKKSTPAPVDLD